MKFSRKGSFHEITKNVHEWDIWDKIQKERVANCKLVRLASLDVTIQLFFSEIDVKDNRFFINQRIKLSEFCPPTIFVKSSIAIDSVVDI